MQAQRVRPYILCAASGDATVAAAATPLDVPNPSITRMPPAEQLRSIHLYKKHLTTNQNCGEVLHSVSSLQHRDRCPGKHPEHAPSQHYCCLDSFSAPRSLSFTAPQLASSRPD